MRASLELARAGMRVAVLSKVFPTRSHTVAAQGGIAAKETVHRLGVPPVPASESDVRREGSPFGLQSGLLKRNDLDEHERQEDRDGVVGRGFHFDGGADTPANLQASSVNEEEHSRRVGGGNHGT